MIRVGGISTGVPRILLGPDSSAGRPFPPASEHIYTIRPINEPRLNASLGEHEGKPPLGINDCLSAVSGVRMVARAPVDIPKRDADIRQTNPRS